MRPVAAKVFLTVLLCLASLLSLRAANLETIRQRQNINQGWKFKLGDYTGAQASSYSDTLWSDVNLPHSFSLPYFLSTQFYTGYGWYRRHLTVLLPLEWQAGVHRVRGRVSGCASLCEWHADRRASGRLHGLFLRPHQRGRDRRQCHRRAPEQ
ncbi:MAG: hypothetical protein QM796_08685 [Chthoniobacteraceae bacterium]